ncbi:unnamed protein product [Microthlaspi erraticum]|uniref:Uncharacterized protein n=1 Tax=Microthlaspi erraticum TaxID=1685480 RepID=A0A6D2HPP1_9BRAS|nr:unnamed protein product [Microthlaspi erraticum]CAA7018626.1 unnamed protein product [Microthlaspi erraticum]
MRPLLCRQRSPPSRNMAPSLPSPKRASPSPSPTTVTRSRRSKTPRNEALNPSFADLPSCLIEIIMFHLTLKDNIIASTACKSFREAAESVRVVGKHPWLLCFPKHGKSFELRDPLQCSCYTLNIPELANSTVCYVREGWLLMRKYKSNDMFFFNPFSKELISLLNCEMSFDEVAFSCPPTSDNCVVVALKFFSMTHVVIITTCHPHVAAEWITKEFSTSFDRRNKYSQLVYLNDRFYCFNDGGRPRSRKVYLAEKKGELFVLFTCGNEEEEPLVYKLVSLTWQEMSSSKTTYDLKIFISFYNSELRTNLPTSNNVYRSMDGYDGKRRVSIHRSYEFGCMDLLKICPPGSLWIDPPKDVLDFMSFCESFA